MIYRKGTRLRMTKQALREHLDGPHDRRTGIYVGPSREHPGSIRVHRHGIKRPETYAAIFWEEDQ